METGDPALARTRNGTGIGTSGCVALLPRTSPLVSRLSVTDSDDQCTLLFSFHHSITDGWSQGIFETELSSVYTSVISGAEPALPLLELDYADYAAWQYNQLKHSEFAQGLTYWNETLQGAPELLDLPIDGLLPGSANISWQRRSGLICHMNCRITCVPWRVAVKVTFFMVMCTAYAILLSYYCRQEDLVIGIPLANRQRKELEHVLGYFVNMLPLRVDICAVTLIFPNCFTGYNKAHWMQLSGRAYPLKIWYTPYPIIVIRNIRRFIRRCFLWTN